MRYRLTSLAALLAMLTSIFAMAAFVEPAGATEKGGGINYDVTSTPVVINNGNHSGTLEAVRPECTPGSPVGYIDVANNWTEELGDLAFRDSYVAVNGVQYRAEQKELFEEVGGNAVSYTFAMPAEGTVDVGVSTPDGYFSATATVSWACSTDDPYTITGEGAISCYPDDVTGEARYFFDGNIENPHELQYWDVVFEAEVDNVAFDWMITYTDQFDVEHTIVLDHIEASEEDCSVEIPQLEGPAPSARIIHPECGVYDFELEFTNDGDVETVFNYMLGDDDGAAAIKVAPFTTEVVPVALLEGRSVHVRIWNDVKGVQFETIEDTVVAEECPRPTSVDEPEPICGSSSPAWNEDTQSCQLAFTGPKEIAKALIPWAAVLGIFGFICLMFESVLKENALVMAEVNARY